MAAPQDEDGCTLASPGWQRIAGVVAHEQLQLQEALSLRGIQVASPNANLKVNKMMLRAAVNWLAHLFNRSVRPEGTMIELK